jgi:hypothetical protein
LVGDFGDSWRSERRRRHELALAYHKNVFDNEGVDARTWIERYQTAVALGDLAAAFSLIHRNVAPLSDERWGKHRGPRVFPASRRPSGLKCQSILVWGYHCPLAVSGRELELDHSWPYSLGGRSEPSNGVWLCMLHNRAKSFDVHNFEWPDDWPSWLLQMLALVRRDCEDELRASAGK